MSAEKTNLFGSNFSADGTDVRGSDSLGPIGFAGREDIIALLNRQASSWPHMHGIILHGRRQIGKSWLVRKYCETSGKPYIYFQATRDDIANEEMLAATLADFMRIHSRHYPNAFTYNFSNHLYDLFDLCFRICKDTGATLVIDEFNFLAESKSFDLSVFQALIDKIKDCSNFLFILCGSNSGVLTSLTKYENPLYGRFSSIIEMHPISHKYTMRLLSNISDIESRIMASIICSGMPQLILDVLDAADYSKFIANLLDGGKLRGMIRSLFQSERLSYDFMYDLAELLSKAAYSRSELKSKMSPKFASDFDVLYQKALDIRLVQEINCSFSRHLSKNRRVSLTNMLIPLRAEFERSPQVLFNKFVMQDKTLHEFFGLPFEDFCAQFLEDVLSIPYCIRCYWEDKVDEVNERREVDVILQEPGSNTAYICECKFKSTQADTDVVGRLLENIGFMSLKGVKAVPVVVSLGGFTSQALLMAEEHGVLLYSGSDIEKWASQ